MVGNLVTIPIATRIDISGFEFQWLHVRGHAFSATGNADSVIVDVVSSAFTPDDPATEFAATGTSLATITLNGATTPAVPNLQVSAFLAANSPTEMVNVTVTGKRGTAQNTLFSAKLSIDLVLKTAGMAPGPIRRMRGTFAGYR